MNISPRPVLFLISHDDKQCMLRITEAIYKLWTAYWGHVRVAVCVILGHALCCWSQLIVFIFTWRRVTLCSHQEYMTFEIVYIMFNIIAEFWTQFIRTGENVAMLLTYWVWFLLACILCINEKNLKVKCQSHITFTKLAVRFPTRTATKLA